jgi:hypothetical protein
MKVGDNCYQFYIKRKDYKKAIWKLYANKSDNLVEMDNKHMKRNKENNSTYDRIKMNKILRY